MYTTYDFEESLRQVSLPAKPVKVIKAWGGSPDGFGSWEGGFVMELENGQFAYLSGWCDTTGWGCQDGAEVVIAGNVDELSLPKDFNRHQKYGFEIVWDTAPEWDDNPADLNNLLRGRVKGIDE